MGMSEVREYIEPEPAAAKIGLNFLSAAVFVGVVFLAMGYALAVSATGQHLLVVIVGGVCAAAFLSLSPRVADQWEHAVVLRFGRFTGLRGAGLFWVVPFIDRVVLWIDLRVRATGFAAEKTLTADTVPVNVDAVLFWNVSDPERAALQVEDYEAAVAWAAQTALRDVIGKTDLATMLTGREHSDHEMQKRIDARTKDWGVHVHSVEIRDVVIPPALEDAMSRRAQAEREKQARVILGDAEVEIADKFSQASKTYRENGIALQLRSLNLLYEGMKERGTLMVVPSSMMDSMNVGNLAGLASVGSNGAEKTPV
jgi:regulator of protease activity HflC (stomatin/prohibitin superfamily)